MTVESVSVSRDGLHKPEEEPTSEDEEVKARREEAARLAELEKQKKAAHPKKQKKPKFRYETKMERSIANKKQKIRKLKARGE